MGFIVYIRFFVGAKDTFPFKQFESLPDHLLEHEKRKIVREWYTEPANREMICHKRREVTELKAEWAAAHLARPGMNRDLPYDPPPEKFSETEDVYPDFSDVAVIEGWGGSEITERLPVARFASRGDAEAAQAALSVTMATALSRKNETDGITPCLTVVSETTLGPGLAAAESIRIESWSAPRDTATFAEVLVISCLADIQNTLKRIADEGPEPDARGRMTVAQANRKATMLVGELGRAFFDLSEREQAKKIGCHVKTWKLTEVYNEAKRTGRLQKPRKKGIGSPKVVSFTNRLEDTYGVGEKDGIANQVSADDELERLTREQEDDLRQERKPKARRRKA